MARKKAAAKPEPSEYQIHAAVADHVRLRGRKGLIWFHPANGAKRTKPEAARLKRMGVTPGIPDLIFIFAGRTYGLELKKAKGRPSIEQLAMIQSFKAAGAEAAIAAGVDAALNVLISWGLLTDGRRTATHASATPSLAFQ